MYDILKEYRSAVKKEDLTTLNKSLYEKFKTEQTNMSFSEFKNELKKLNLNVENFVIIKNNHINNIYYRVKNFYIPAYIDVELTKITLVKQVELLNDIKDDDYYKIFMFAPEPFRVIIYEDLYPSIPDNLKYEIWRNVWIRIDYGGNLFKQEIIDEIFRLKKLANAKNDIPDEDITIYRGANTESTPIYKAISWTTDKTVAEFFANRFGSLGQIYKAKINKRDIIDIINDRNEHEIIVQYKDLKDIKKVTQ